MEECDLGFDESETDRSCNWLANGLCYDDKDEACDCICPRNEDSISSLLPTVNVSIVAPRGGVPEDTPLANRGLGTEAA